MVEVPSDAHMEQMTVVDSYLDVNNHMNYAEYVLSVLKMTTKGCDQGALPKHCNPRNAKVKRLELLYESEAKLGDEVTCWLWTDRHHGDKETESSSLFGKMMRPDGRDILSIKVTYWPLSQSVHSTSRNQSASQRIASNL